MIFNKRGKAFKFSKVVAAFLHGRTP